MVTRIVVLKHGCTVESPKSLNNADTWVLDPRNSSFIGLEGGLDIGILQVFQVTQQHNQRGGTLV